MIKENKKHCKLSFRIIVCLLLTLVLICGFVFFKGELSMLKSNAKINGIEAYQKTAEQIAVPNNCKIVALGEATHGNFEFQEMKLSIFKHLVNNYGVKAFALEADFGEGIFINEFIHGGSGTAKEAVSNLSFEIYHTQSFMDLIQWMRDYNETAAEKDKLSFYGFDMQNPSCNAQLLMAQCTNEEDKKAILPLASKEQLSFANPDVQAAFSAVEKIKNTVENPLAKQAAQNIMSAYDYYKEYQSNIVGASALRDYAMAQNVAWISEYENKKGNSCIFIAAHNGHVAHKGSSVLYEKNMGSHLTYKYGNAYFVIGTDYYKSVCASKGNSGWKSYRVYSEDKLAAQAKNTPNNMYYLDFSDVTEESGSLFGIIHSPMEMGNFAPGGYSLLNALYIAARPSLTRQTETPADLYDAMYFVYNASPIKVLNLN